jgi:hypothetical protein
METKQDSRPAPSDGSIAAHCPHCRRTVRADEEYCSRCGFKLHLGPRAVPAEESESLDYEAPDTLHASPFDVSGGPVPIAVSRLAAAAGVVRAGLKWVSNALRKRIKG